MFNNFYKGKKVLITGHTGFKGSWLTIWLNMLGAKVIGYALDPKTKKDNFVLTHIAEEIKDYRGDIRDKEKVFDLFTKEKPEIVFHLAAQPLVIESYEKPVETYATNIMGTVNILEAIRQTQSVQAGVIITSDKCYENKELTRGYREDEPMGGFDPYSSSKGAAELVINAYRHSYFAEENTCNIASTRAGNVIGGGDWSENRIIPDSVRAFEENQPVFLRKPQATRPWQHVLEPLSGYLLLAEKLYNDKIYSQAWNFGPEEDSIQTVKELVTSFIKYYGKGQLEFDNKTYPHEANLLALDITKAKTKLKWQQVWDFENTVKYTAEWYRSYKQEKVREITLSQIQDYTRKWK